MIIRSGPSGPEASWLPNFGLLTEPASIGEIGPLAFKDVTIIDPQFAMLVEGQVIQALFAPQPNGNLIIAFATVVDVAANEIQVTVYNGTEAGDNFGNQRFFVLGYPVVAP